MEKSEGLATSLTFLGIVLDSTLQQLRLPPAKLQEITSLTKSWLGKRQSQQASSSCIASSTSPSQREGSTTEYASMLMPEPMLSGGTAFCHPGTAWQCALLRTAIHLYTDASSTLGFGAYLNGAWIRGNWQQHQQLPGRSIQRQELFSILAVALTWGHLLSGQRIRFHCNSTSVTNTTPPSPTASRALEDHLQFLLTKAVAPSTSWIPALQVEEVDGANQDAALHSQPTPDTL
ncbi:hypothetical protein EMCRGX_G015816 [Ephydatia muelleri]